MMVLNQGINCRRAFWGNKIVFGKSKTQKPIANVQMYFLNN